jgi:hypothetical protein
VEEKKSKQIKIYVVIGLSLILLIVAYFRFVHQRKESVGGHESPNTPVPQAAIPIPQVDLAHVRMQIQQKSTQDEFDRHETLPTFIRDIFSPMKPLRKAEPSPTEQRGPRRAPSFELKGTIVGGGNSIAIIDDRFLRTGDSIGNYTVVRIAKNKVTLSADDRQIVLEVLENKRR